MSLIEQLMNEGVDPSEIDPNSARGRLAFGGPTIRPPVNEDVAAFGDLVASVPAPLNIFTEGTANLIRDAGWGNKPSMADRIASAMEIVGIAVPPARAGASGVRAMARDRAMNWDPGLSKAAMETPLQGTHSTTVDHVAKMIDMEGLAFPSIAIQEAQSAPRFGGNAHIYFDPHALRGGYQRAPIFKHDAYTGTVSIQDTKPYVDKMPDYIVDLKFGADIPHLPGTKAFDYENIIDPGLKSTMKYSARNSWLPENSTEEFFEAIGNHVSDKTREWLVPTMQLGEGTARGILRKNYPNVDEHYPALLMNQDLDWQDAFSALSPEDAGYGPFTARPDMFWRALKDIDPDAANDFAENLAFIWDEAMDLTPRMEEININGEFIRRLNAQGIEDVMEEHFPELWKDSNNFQISFQNLMERNPNLRKWSTQPERGADPLDRFAATIDSRSMDDDGLPLSFRQMKETPEQAQVRMMGESRDWRNAVGVQMDSISAHSALIGGPHTVDQIRDVAQNFGIRNIESSSEGWGPIVNKFRGEYSSFHEKWSDKPAEFVKTPNFPFSTPENFRNFLGDMLRVGSRPKSLPPQEEYTMGEMTEIFTGFHNAVKEDALSKGEPLNTQQWVRDLLDVMTDSDPTLGGIDSFDLAMSTGTSSSASSVADTIGGLKKVPPEMLDDIAGLASRFMVDMYRGPTRLAEAKVADYIPFDSANIRGIVVHNKGDATRIESMLSRKGIEDIPVLVRPALNDGTEGYVDWEDLKGFAFGIASMGMAFNMLSNSNHQEGSAGSLQEPRPLEN